jgi:hypothetical protein
MFWPRSDTIVSTLKNVSVLGRSNRFLLSTHSKARVGVYHSFDPKHSSHNRNNHFVWSTYFERWVLSNHSFGSKHSCIFRNNHFLLATLSKAIISDQLCLPAVMEDLVNSGSIHDSPDLIREEICDDDAPSTIASSASKALGKCNTQFISTLLFM